METFEIVGGARLKGKIEISGAKNAALPIMAACILVEGETVLHNVPDLADVRHMQVLLTRLGVKSYRDESGAMHLKVEDEMNAHAEYELVSKMRASICVMGPLLAKRRRSIADIPTQLQRCRLFMQQPIQVESCEDDSLISVRFVQAADGAVGKHSQTRIRRRAFMQQTRNRPGTAFIATQTDGQAMPSRS